MTQVTRKWIEENVESLYCFGGQVDKKNYKEYVVGIKALQTTLSAAAVRGEVEIKGKFGILIPGLGGLLPERGILILEDIWYT